VDEHSGLVEHNIKLCDLGLVTFGGVESIMKGTRDFFAPEIASSGTKYGCAAADMFSCGVSIVDLLDRLPEHWDSTYDLYYDPEAIDHKAFQDGLKFHVKRMKRVDYGLDSHAMDFALELLAYKPENRLTAEEALRHPWLQDYEL
jgi:serine/threonine protein kinase